MHRVQLFMRFHSYNRSVVTGMTVIEMIIYVSLLSFLLSSYIAYTYEIHIRTIQLSQEIDDAENNE